MNDIELIDEIQGILCGDNKQLIIGITPFTIKISIENFKGLPSDSPRIEAVIRLLDSKNRAFQENGHGIVITR